MNELFYDNVTIDIADKWCRDLYYKRLKTLDLKGKKILELGCHVGYVTEKLIADKNLYQYDYVESVDSIKENIQECRKKFPNHVFINDCITSLNLESYLKYDTYLIFYCYVTMYKNEMIRILRKLVNDYHKEVIIYESFIDDFNDSGAKYNSIDFDAFIRLKSDRILRISNELIYLKEFKTVHKNGFVYLYPKDK